MSGLLGAWPVNEEAITCTEVLRSPAPSDPSTPVVTEYFLLCRNGPLHFYNNLLIPQGIAQGGHFHTALTPLARSTVPGGLNTIGNNGSTTASLRPNTHTHIHENTHQNIPVKALLGSLSIQGHFRQHPSGGSVPNHS